MFSLCIPTMDRYDKFLSNYLPKYLDNELISEIIITDENGYDIQKINESVWVFKNAIKNTEDIIKYFENTKEWKDWFTFGKVADGPNLPTLTFETFPSPEEWKIAKNNSFTGVEYSQEEIDSISYENQIDDLFYHSTKLYVESDNVVLDNWIMDGWNIAKYIPNLQDHSEYAMMHHTDFQREFAYNPDLKFGVTAVFYLNEDYDGGEVMFRFLDENDRSVIKEDHIYKPGKGDIVVFPSGPPHYHGVKAITSGEKYIIRNYWRYEYPGHPLWLKLQEKYGEDLWRELEEKRRKFNRSSDGVEIVNNIPFWVEFEEYYKKEIDLLDL